MSIDGNNGDTPSAKRQKLYSTGTAEQSAGQLPASRGALLPGSLQGSLQVFPSELVFRVLSFLSAEDLTAAAPVCRHFRIAACSNMLWRRLFDARYIPDALFGNAPALVMEYVCKVLHMPKYMLTYSCPVN